MPKYFTLLERLFFAFFVLSVVFIIFMAGALATYPQGWLYLWIDKAAQGYTQLHEKHLAFDIAPQYQPVTESPHLEVMRRQGTSGDYTLYASLGRPVAVLIDLDGNKVHEWQNLSAMQGSGDRPGKDVYWDDAHLFPNGDMLVVQRNTAGGTTCDNCGILRINKDSKLIWHYPARIHNHLSVARNGTIYALEQERIKVLRSGVEATVMDDYLVILNPEGKQLHRISLNEALHDAGPPHEYLLRGYARGKYNKGDLMHANSATVLEPDIAAAFPMFKAGQVLISMQSMNAIGMLDVPTRKFVWTAQGDWLHQSDAAFIPDGRIMFFDAQGSKSEGSRILAYLPKEDQIQLLYMGNKENPFFSSENGAQQLLPNNNLLVTEAEDGRIFETTPKGKIVWEMLNPYQQGNIRLQLLVGKRYTREELPFLDSKIHQK